MTEEEKKSLAAQLRKPSGEIGVEVADFMNKGNELINRNTIKQLNLKDRQTVLEVGMGNGKFIPELLEIAQDLHYIGCDFSELMVSESKANNKDLVERGMVQFHHTTASDLPVGDQSVDSIFTVNTLYFWEDQSAILNEFKRVLKHQGQLAIGIRPKALMRHYGFVKYGFNMFDPEDVVSLLEEHDFKQVNYVLIDEPDFETEEERFEVKSLVVVGQA